MSATVIEPVTEPTYAALSHVNEEGDPIVGTCTLIVGDNTGRIEFRKGRATVPHRLAHLVAGNPHIDVIGFDPTVVPVVALTPAPAATAADGIGGEPALLARIAELEAMLKSVAALVPAPPAEAPAAPAADPAADAKRAEAVRLAQEYLAAEGEDVPEPIAKTAVSRDGFEAETVDGQPRCQAAKGDGGQCSNAAVDDGAACQIGKHKEQLAP